MGVTGLVFGGAPPSFRGALFLALSTFLCGCVAAGFVFVGFWRHTATQKAQTEAAQQTAQQQLREAEHTLAGLKTQLAREQQLLAGTRRKAAQATTALARTRKQGRALERSLALRLHELTQAATALAGQSATIESELTALESYAQHPGAAGVDAGYLATQTHYIVRSAAAAAAAAATLTQAGRDVQGILDAAPITSSSAPD